jgi:hypothetical protein
MELKNGGAYSQAPSFQQIRCRGRGVQDVGDARADGYVSTATCLTIRQEL